MDRSPAHIHHRALKADPAGGGLVGIASTLSFSGRPVIEALVRLRWRGNGRGGGVALVGCFPGLSDHYTLNIALRERLLRAEVERAFIEPYFDIADAEFQPELDDYRQLAGLVLRPPVVVRYFVRVTPPALTDFAARNGFTDPVRAGDEFVYQIAARLNRALYAGRRDWQAFVLSHGRDMMILKAAGFAEDVARFYRLDEMQAHIWLGSQTYATHTHPGGANPFPGADAALALSGGFANSHALTTYVRQRGYAPLFQSDAELAAMLFDFYSRACAYPIDLALEAALPTPADGLDRLPEARRNLYHALGQAHAHGAPAGPAFFLIARKDCRSRAGQLIAAVDPQATRSNVFALQEGTLGSGEPYGVGVVASERQVAEATFERIAEEQSAVCPVPDQIWSAHSRISGEEGDGGAYIFTVALGQAVPTLTCADKFGRPIVTDRARTHRDFHYTPIIARELKPRPDAEVSAAFRAGKVEAIYAEVREAIRGWSFAALGSWLDQVVALASADPALHGPAVQLLTLLHDRKYDTGVKKRSAALALLRRGLDVLFNAPTTDAAVADPADPDRRLTWVTLVTRGAPTPTEGTLYIDAADLPLEGPDSLAQVLVRVYRAGWRRVVLFGCKGDRFVGSGLGPDSAGLRVDLYGTPGDYLAAGLDGAAIHVHGSAQDMTGHLMTRGTLVIHGDVGQAFLYGARGGEAYVLGEVGARAFADAGGALRVAYSAGRQYVDFASEGKDSDALRADQQETLRKNAAFFSLPFDPGAF